MLYITPSHIYIYSLWQNFFPLQFHESTTPKSQDTTARMEVIKVQEEDKVFKPKQ